MRGGGEAISVEPDCRLAIIGPASASRCKVGLLVFQWLLPSVAPLDSWRNASFLEHHKICAVVKCNFSDEAYSFFFFKSRDYIH